MVNFPSCFSYGYNPASYNYHPAKSTNQQRRNRYLTYTDSVQNACRIHDTVVPSRDPYDLQTCYEDNYYYEQYQDKIHTYRLHQNKAVLNQNCTTYNEFQDDVNLKSAKPLRKKYPVTVKTPK